MVLGTKKTSKPTMKIMVHPKQCNTQSYIVIKIVILDQIHDMIASFHSQNYGEDVLKSPHVKKAVQACRRVICGGYSITIYLFFQQLLLIHTFHLVLEDII